MFLGLFKGNINAGTLRALEFSISILKIFVCVFTQVFRHPLSDVFSDGMIRHNWYLSTWMGGQAVFPEPLRSGVGLVTVRADGWFTLLLVNAFVHY
jgi:hypothetical protein